MNRTRSLVWVAVAYLVAMAAAWGAWRLLSGQPLWLLVSAADVAATVAIFGFSVAFNNSSIYDPYWSIAPMVAAPVLAVVGVAAGGDGARAWLVAALVMTWGARLTWNWLRSWHGMTQEDWRYINVRKATGRGYWAASFFGLHLMPTVAVLLGMWPLLPAMTVGRPLGILDGVATLVTLTGILLEGIADEQLRSFRRRATTGQIMEEGLWGRCRHPNYLGEITFWWGVYLFGLAASPSSWHYTIVGAAYIHIMFVFITIPMIDKRSLERRPLYGEHMARMSALLPFGRR